MNVLDLFSGIGGFSLGLERAGMRTVAFCEIDPYCRAVLAKRWPDVPVFGDVRELTAKALADAAWHVCAKQTASRAEWQRTGASSQSIDVICGGFPCQDISVAGKGAGLDGERSGLWSEYARIIGEVRPRYVIVENVAALLGRGLERVLGDLAALGYDAEWHCIPASAVGAPHRRDRVWIVAYSNSAEWRTISSARDNQGANGHAQWQESSGGFKSGRKDVAHADEPRLEGWLGAELCERVGEFAAGPGRSQWDEQQWFAQSGMGRISNGTANRVDRLRALGNAVVPQIPEIIGRAIMRAHDAR